jgi:hypothetical protein
VIEAKQVGFDVLGGARRNVEIALYLNLSRRHLISDECERGRVHNGAPLHGDKFSS